MARAGGGRGFPRCRVSVSPSRSQQGDLDRWEKSFCSSLLDGTSCCPLALFLVESKPIIVSRVLLLLGSSPSPLQPISPKEGFPGMGSPAFCASPLDSPSTDPALRVPSSLHRTAPLHPLRGLLRGHAHPHHLEEGRARHPLWLWGHHREQGVHELPADLQRLPQAQRELHLHRQQ